MGKGPWDHRPPSPDEAAEIAEFRATIASVVRRKAMIMSGQLAITLFFALSIAAVLNWRTDALVFAAVAILATNALSIIQIAKSVPQHLVLMKEPATASVRDLDRLSLTIDAIFVAAYIIAPAIFLVAALHNA